MNEDNDDLDIDVQDDMDSPDGLEQEAEKPSLKDVWQNNPLLKIGGAVLAGAIAIFAYTTLTKPNPIEETKSVVMGADTSDVKALPGKETVDKAYVDAVQTKNQQRAEVAEITGGSAMPTPIAAAKTPGIEIPQAAGNNISDPLQEWKRNVQARKINSDEVSFEDDVVAPPPQPELVPMVQPIQPQAVVKMDPAAAQALAGQMRTIIAAQVPPPSKVLNVTPVKSAYDRQLEEAKAAVAQTGRMGVTGAGPDNVVSSLNKPASAKVIVPAGQIAYAQLLTELNSDVPAPALAAVLSGPFVGARMIGKMARQDEYIVITFDRIIKDDVSYKVNGIALDEKTTLPAHRTDIDHHYFSRIILPAAAKFVQGYGSAVAETGTTTTTTAGGGIATDKPKPSAKESIYKGVESAAQTISDVIQEDAKKEPTIRVARGTTMGVLFLESVKTSSVEQ